jgi:hypothetical protein
LGAKLRELLQEWERETIRLSVEIAGFAASANLAQANFNFRESGAIANHRL